MATIKFDLDPKWNYPDSLGPIAYISCHSQFHTENSEGVITKGPVWSDMKTFVPEEISHILAKCQSVTMVCISSIYDDLPNNSRFLYVTGDKELLVMVRMSWNQEWGEYIGEVDNES